MDELTEQQEAFERIYEDKEVSDLLFKKIHDDIIPIDKPRRKSYVSPYAKFDKIRRKRNDRSRT